MAGIVHLRRIVEMKNIFGCSLILAASLNASTARASSFTILEVHNEILGQLSGAIDRADGGVDLVNEQYHLTSNASLQNEIIDTAHSNLPGQFSYARSIAAGPFVYAAIDEPGPLGTVAASAAEAIATVVFRPTVDGSAGPLFIFGGNPIDGWFAGPKASWTITDLTSGALVTFGIPGARTSSPAPIPTPETTYSLLGDSVDYAWNSSHSYQMTLVVQTSSNHGSDVTWLSTNMFEVPEPPTVLLLSFALGTVAAFRRAR